MSPRPIADRPPKLCNFVEPNAQPLLILDAVSTSTSPSTSGRFDDDVCLDGAPSGSYWQVGEELTGVGTVDARKYCLSVCLGDRIPMETNAAKVNVSRLETRPDWRDFMHCGMEGELHDGLAMDILLECPCCLGILRRPVALPCGHSLCRGCLMRLPHVGRTDTRQCPLCRAIIPRMRLHVNEPLDAVTEALHTFRMMQKACAQSLSAPSGRTATWNLHRHRGDRALP
mmetsp:Transcript_62661/g.136079  ORF Transcript_62661/g.136079 Transcript_62661/m.136079 type:complete len:228 (-) Transcript_62661:147-830(-)